MRTYDVICIGVGGVGSAALLHAARRGLSVLGLDRFPPGHDRGSSHGETRIIRLVYMEHPNYVPLLRRAYALWRELGERVGRPLLHRAGILYAGPREGGVIAALESCAEAHGLSLERLSARRAEARWPAFRIPPGFECAHEEEAGYLEVEACVRAQSALAEEAGADLRVGVSVDRWQADADGVTVVADGGRFRGRRLVLAPGAWAASLAGGDALPRYFEVRRKEVFWFEVAGEPHTRAGGCPLFYFQTGDGSFYGFPDLGGNGLKVAEHTGGESVGDPLAVDRAPHPRERARVEGFLARHLPGVTRNLLRHDVCLYTMTPDEHFVVDEHPASPRVLVVAGLSGHGFKFVPVLGEAAAEWATGAPLSPALSFLSLSRFRIPAP